MLSTDYYDTACTNLVRENPTEVKDTQSKNIFISVFKTHISKTLHYLQFIDTELIKDGTHLLKLPICIEKECNSKQYVLRTSNQRFSKSTNALLHQSSPCNPS